MVAGAPLFPGNSAATSLSWLLRDLFLCLAPLLRLYMESLASTAMNVQVMLGSTAATPSSSASARASDAPQDHLYRTDAPQFRTKEAVPYSRNKEGGPHHQDDIIRNPRLVYLGGPQQCPYSAQVVLVLHSGGCPSKRPLRGRRATSQRGHLWLQGPWRFGASRGFWGPRFPALMPLGRQGECCIGGEIRGHFW